jgi:hypothetical protein
VGDQTSYFLVLLFQVINLCERLAGQDARVTTVPVGVLRFTRQLTRLFQWTNDVADRLAFSEVDIFFAYLFSPIVACFYSWYYPL